jgi:glycine cleavage system aminomethyltransferase T
VSIRDVTAATCALGLWGPRAADVLSSVVAGGTEALAFGRFRVRELDVGGVPVLAQSVSYVGEPGWELSTSADLGLHLWDLLWERAGDTGLVAAGRRAFETLRLEAGYPAAGVDVTAEHRPGPAGLGRFAPGADEGGRDDRVLVRLEVDGIVGGGEPVRAGERTIGYVTSGARADGPGLAFAWLDRDHPSEVDVVAFDDRLTATVVERVEVPRVGGSPLTNGG